MWMLLATALMLWIVLGTWGLVRTLARPPAEAFGHALARGLPTDPGEADFSWKDEVYRTADGIDLPLWRIEGGTPGGPTLIMLHDWGSSPIALLDELRDLLPGFNMALLPTLRGHGSHSGRCSLGPREIDDLQTLLATTKGEIVLHGIGLGGMIVTACAGQLKAANLQIVDAWHDRFDGIRHILALRGQPAFPFAWTARICLP
jgi:pimeloyl-ACP methyl ester carboxylesterase